MSRWSEEDLGYALAWQAEQDAQCGGCGQPKDVSMDPTLEDAWSITTARCFVCAAIARKSKAQADGGMETEGLYFGATRSPVA